ncbi:GTP-binding protein [Candidatus Bathyarchaeota archaeon]|nr:GTP-binding protein [Candidatus Bathyarchaeota archaeon]
MQLSYKVIMCGDSSVGKTSMVIRFTENRFTETKATIGVGFSVKDLQVTEKLKIRLQIWDFAGESKFRTLLPKFTIGASGCLLLFDTTNVHSIESFDEWFDIIRSNTFIEHDDGNKSPIPIIVIGAKSDLVQDEMLDDKIQAYLDAFLHKHEDISCMRVSSKSGHNVGAAFTSLAMKMHEHHEGRG